jgi:hypothetical protein
VSPFDPTDPRSLARRAEVYALAFEEAGKSLAYQERIVEQLRGRGAGIAATAAVTMSIFGGPAIGRGATSEALYVATAAFVGACFCVLGLLWPRHLVAATDVGELLPTYAEPNHAPLALVHRELAVHRADGFVRNRNVIDRMTRLSRVALVLLSVEILAWVVNYALTL